LAGDGRLAELVADLLEPRANLGVAQALDLVLELVGFIDQGLDPSELTIVRVDEAGKETHGPRSIGGLPSNPDQGRSPPRLDSPLTAPRRATAAARVSPPPTTDARSLPQPLHAGSSATRGGPEAKMGRRRPLGRRLLARVTPPGARRCCPLVHN